MKVGWSGVLYPSHDSPPYIKAISFEMVEEIRMARENQEPLHGSQASGNSRGIFIFIKARAL